MYVCLSAYHSLSLSLSSAHNISVLYSFTFYLCVCDHSCLTVCLSLSSLVKLCVCLSAVKENYRPVSCLPAASKLLELVVNDQTSNFLESNGLLPHNQHGFRPMRSTMTAWADIQKQWAQNDDIKIAGVLLWDHSTAL